MRSSIHSMGNAAIFRRLKDGNSIGDSPRRLILIQKARVTMSNPFMFIVGCSRSGTTLLQHVVAAHPQIAIIPETRWFARWYEKRRCITADGMVTSEMIFKLLEKHRLFRD